MPNRPECLGPVHYLIDYETILDRFLLETRLADAVDGRLKRGGALSSTAVRNGHPRLCGRTIM